MTFPIVDVTMCLCLIGVKTAVSKYILKMVVLFLKIDCTNKPLTVAITPNEYILSNDDTEHKLIVNKFSP